MKIISVLDTSVTSFNLGNQIIMEAIYDVLEEIFPDDFFFSLPWEGKISRVAHRYMRSSDYVFFGGTNSLTSHMIVYSQMGFRARDLIRFGNLILFGMGWWQYQSDPDIYTRMFIKRLLSNSAIHSVRDEYTKKKLANIGIDNVVNTCCPTTWNLTQEHCSKVPAEKADNVVLTLTDYNKSIENDIRLVNYLLDSYDKIYFWIQGVGDKEYINKLGELSQNIKFISPKLKAYDEVLQTVDCDYIGTRLHAGIRAIQRCKRTLILSVDNRAKEISTDIGLNIASRNDFSRVQEFIENTYTTHLNIPIEGIKTWKHQFSSVKQRC